MNFIVIERKYLDHNNENSLRHYIIMFYKEGCFHFYSAIKFLKKLLNQFASLYKS